MKRGGSEEKKHGKACWKAGKGRSWQKRKIGTVGRLAWIPNTMHEK